MEIMRSLLVSVFVLLLFTLNVMANERNDVIFDAMSPYENLTEYALNAEILRVTNSISSLDGVIAKVKDVVSNQTMQNLKIIVKKLQAAEKQKNYSEIALLAVDSYKSLADELDPTTLKVPKQVIMLDYVGFKVRALLRQNKKNWHLISETVDEGKKQWQQVKAKVTSNGLYDAANTTITGLERAATSKNIDMLDFAAQVNLDLVDLLEGFFEKAK